MTKLNSDPSAPNANTQHRRLAPAIQVISLAVVLTVAIAAIPLSESLEDNPTPSYFALFITAVVSGALFMLPGFGWAAIGAFAITFDTWFLPALIGTTGQVLGELYSYFLGYTGSRWIKQNRWYVRLHKFMQRHGFLTITVLAATPNPIFDLTGAVAGALGLGWHRFYIASWLGRFIKNILIAVLALRGADFILAGIGY